MTRRWAFPLAFGAGVALLAFGATVVFSGGGEGSASAPLSAPASRSGSTRTASVPCPTELHQSCDEGTAGPPAPFTKPVMCVDGRADYDGNEANGCEAAPDTVPDNSPLVGTRQANLVPNDDVDRWTLIVKDNFQPLCDGTLTVSLTAPTSVSMQLELLDSTGNLRGMVASIDGARSSIRLAEQSCGGNDATILTARVSWIGPQRSAQDYAISASGSF